MDSKLLSTHVRSYFSLLPGRIRSNEANHRSLIEEREKVKRDLEVSLNFSIYSKTCVKRPLSKRPQSSFQYQLSLNTGKSITECSNGEHSAILSIFNKLPFVIKIFVLSIFEWWFYCNLSNVVCHCKSFIDILTIQNKV